MIDGRWGNFMGIGAERHLFRPAIRSLLSLYTSSSSVGISVVKCGKLSGFGNFYLLCSFFNCNLYFFTNKVIRRPHPARLFHLARADSLRKRKIRLQRGERNHDGH